MIVLVDTTVIASNPFLTSTAWKMLAHASHRWDVRLCTTEVVLLESVANYERRVDEAKVGFDKWSERHAPSLGLEDSVGEMRSRLDEHAASYDALLKSALEALPVEVCAVPDVEHRILVERATQRKPPCDQHGDGYRDTLNWLTVVELAKESDDNILWVSADSDFTAPDVSGLHPQLELELNELGLSGRVTLERSLQDAALHIAATFAKDTEKDLRKVQARLKKETLATYVQAELLEDPTTIAVDRVSLALPVGAHRPVISTVGAVTESAVQVKAPLDGEAAAIEVILTCDATIAVEASAESDLGEHFERFSVPDQEEFWAITTKPLIFAALVTVDRYDRPTSCELTSVRAPEDDPGHRAWRAKSSLRRQLADIDQLLGPSREFQEAVRKAASPTNEWLEAFRNAAAINSQTLDAARKATYPTKEWLEAFRKVAAINTETLDAFRKATYPTKEFLEMIRRLGIGAAGIGQIGPADDTDTPTGKTENDDDQHPSA